MSEPRFIYQDGDVVRVIPDIPPFPIDNVELRIVAAAERELLLKTLAERDALAAQVSELREALDGACDSLELSDLDAGIFRVSLVHSLAQSLAAHDAALLHRLGDEIGRCDYPEAAAIAHDWADDSEASCTR